MFIIPKKKFRKRLFILAFLLLIAGVAVYWFVSTDKFADTKDRTAAFTVNANDFLNEFTADQAAFNKKYNDKIITVNGNASELEVADTTVNIKMIDTLSGSYIIFAFQEQHVDEAKSVNQGDNVSIKGSFSGGVFSPMRKVSVISFKRSTLNK
jgi:hypothetical protein